MRRIKSLTKQLVEGVGSVIGIRYGTEEPRHSVEPVTDGVEIRRYGPRIAAETTVLADEEAARSAGFRRLAGYIFGRNHSRAKIAMTAPVTQQSTAARGDKIAMTAPVAQMQTSAGEWLIRFFMPADKTLQSLPEPDDPAVKLVSVPAETVAVCRFSGTPSRRAVASQTTKLLRILDEFGFEPTDTPAAWFYDPPWTVPISRRNEIAVPVKPAG